MVPFRVKYYLFLLFKDVVSHIQRIGCQPEKNYSTLDGGQSRSWSAKKKSGSAPPSPPPRAARSEKNKNKK